MPRKNTLNGYQFWDADKYDFWDLPTNYADDLTRQFLEAFGIPYTNEDALKGDLHKISDLISLCIQSMKKDYFSKDSIMRVGKKNEDGELDKIETIRTIRITEQAKPLPHMGWIKGEKNYSFFINDEYREVLWVNPQEHEDKDKMPVNPYSYQVPEEGSHIGWGLATAPAYHLSSRYGGIKLSALDSPEKRRRWMAQFGDKLRFNGVEVTVGIPKLEEIEGDGITFSKTSSLDHEFKGIFDNLRDTNWRQSYYLLKNPNAPFPYTGSFKAYTKKTAGSQKFQINNAKNWNDFVSQVDNQLEAGDEISFSTDDVFNRHMKSFPYAAFRSNENIFETHKTYENMGELSQIRFFKDYEVNEKSGSKGKIGGIGYQFVSTNNHVKIIHKNPMSVTLSKHEKTEEYIFDRALWGVYVPFNSSSLYKKLFDDKFNEWKENLIERIDKAKLKGENPYWKKSELTKKNFVKFDNPTPPHSMLEIVVLCVQTRRLCFHRK